MLVQDNIACPFCGNVSVSDVFVVWSDDSPLSFILAVDCVECTGGAEIVIPYGKLRHWLRDLARAFPSDDPRSYARRWRGWFNYSHPAVRRASELLLERGAFDPKLVEHPLLCRISDIIWSSVQTGNKSPFSYPPIPLAVL